MTLGTAELERLADDAYRDRRISGSIYCAACGFNLRTLPYLHRCPECGQEYNARPLKMTGIFLPQEAQFPARDAFGGLFWSVVCGVTLFQAYATSNSNTLVLSLAAAIMAAADLFIAHRRFNVWLKAIKIARRIAAEEGEP